MCHWFASVAAEGAVENQEKRPIAVALGIADCSQSFSSCEGSFYHWPEMRGGHFQSHRSACFCSCALWAGMWDGGMAGNSSGTERRGQHRQHW